MISTERVFVFGVTATLTVEYGLKKAASVAERRVLVEGGLIGDNDRVRPRSRKVFRHNVNLVVISKQWDCGI